MELLDAPNDASSVTVSEFRWIRAFSVCEWSVHRVRLLVEADSVAPALAGDP